eukprot:1360737-Amphidinium_carterae.1
MQLFLEVQSQQLRAVPLLERGCLDTCCILCWLAVLSVEALQLKALHRNSSRELARGSNEKACRPDMSCDGDAKCSNLPLGEAVGQLALDGSTLLLLQSAWCPPLKAQQQRGVPPPNQSAGHDVVRSRGRKAY